MKRDLDSEIRQASRELESARQKYQMLSMQNTYSLSPVERDIQSEEYALAQRSVIVCQARLDKLLSAPIQEGE